MEASDTSSAPRDTDASAAGGAAVVDGETHGPGGADAPANGATQARPHAPELRAGSRSTWILVVCCVAQFMVILDLSIVNVALPSIQSSLNFNSADLQWVIDAYAITFAGFLMLGGRAADAARAAARVRRRARPVLAHVTRRRPLHHQRDARHRPRRPGLQLRVHGRLVAGDHHVVVPARPPAAPRDRAVGGDERRRRRCRRAVRRDHHRDDQLALGAADQSPNRVRDRGHRVRGRGRPAPGRRRPELRRRRRRNAHRRTDSARLRDRPGRAPQLARGGGADSDPRWARAPGVVQPDRDALGVRSADSVQGPDQTTQRRQRDRDPVQRGAVPDVVPELAVSAAGARALPAPRRPLLPADGADHHVRRPQRRQARESLRCACRARRRPDHDDVRDAAVHEDRGQRQPDPVCRAPRRAHGRGHRDVDRALDDRRHPGGQGGTSRPRVGAREHLPPGRGRPRPRGPDHAGDVALKPPHRQGPRGAPGPYRGIPCRLLHRRRPVRRRRPGHVRARAQSGRRRPGPDHEADPDRDRRDGGRRRVRPGRVCVRWFPRRPDRCVHDRQHLQLRDRAGRCDRL